MCGLSVSASLFLYSRPVNVCLTARGASPSLSLSLSVVALGAATGLAQHRVKFVQQIRRHNTLPAEDGSPADGLTAALRSGGRSRGLQVSGRGRGREASRLADVHGGSPVRDLRGLEQVAVLRVVGSRVAVVERNPLVCQLGANMADKHESEEIGFKSATDYTASFTTVLEFPVLECKE